MKVKLFDRRVRGIFFNGISIASLLLSFVLIFVDVPDDWQVPGLISLVVLFVAGYLGVWVWANMLTTVDIYIEGTSVTVKVGDLFKESGLKAIACNEYFDTQVDNSIISERSINGMFIKSYLDIPVPELDSIIEQFQFEADELEDLNDSRAMGKKQKYRLGTILVYKDFLLTAMTKFDESNRAVLTMPEYLEFLIRFWDRVNKVYAQQSVTVPIFGSGITRIKGHRNISDEDLLKIMLWTFRISEMRFKYPAKLSIVVHEEKIDQINLLDLKLLSNGV